ncbi:MAG: alpha/beta fold hydrolase [Acidobacteria bacterium]|nr:alpha/beta fold hydrolase [Acidobacteriota bacterium]
MRLLAFALALLAAPPALTQAADPPASLAGKWEGMLFLGGYFWRFMGAELTQQEGGMQAAIHLPQDAGYSVVAFETAPPGVRFQLARGTSVMAFEGEVRPGAIVGSVVAGKTKGIFQLVRVASPSVSHEKYAGTYQEKQRELIAVAPFDFGDGKSRLAYMNSATGHWGILLPTAAQSFTFAPARFAPFPVDLRLSFRAIGTGHASELRWRRKNGSAGSAKRLDLYTDEPAEYRNGDVKLSGTLIRPRTPGRHPAMAMIHSSGAQSRNGPAGYFRLIANLVAARGVAVLLYDKRGVGTSSGDWTTASFDDLAGDVLAAVEWLKRHKDIDPARIGLWGLSQGGWLAPLVASKTHDLAFLVLVGAPAVSPAQQDIDRRSAILRTDGFSQEEIGEAQAYLELYFDFIRTAKDWDKLHHAAQEARKKRWAGYVILPDGAQGPVVEWWRQSQIAPETVLPALRCPILTIHGDLDDDVEGKKNSAIFRSLVRSPGSEHLLYTGAEHHLLVEPRHGEQGYPQLADGYLRDMLQWIEQRAKVSEGRKTTTLR